MNQEEPAISLQSVTVSYREFTALRDVSLQVRCKEILGLSGPNGAGKTTILRLLQGLIFPRSGTITVLGDELTRRSAHRLRPLIACVPQVLEIDRRVPVSAADVVMMGRYGNIGLFRRADAMDREIAESAIAMVGADHLSARPFGRLSGGERQRVMIARAVAQKPRIMLLDEPNTYLDADSREHFARLIRRIQAEEGLTLIVVSHDAPFLCGLCDRIATMNGGTISDHEPIEAEGRI